ncbi:hypothetical protein BJ508DRAFT_420056 [Ascobolus immersus RN42]|uniref:Invertebrate defensins family profile domain-containing protein n=1 Tax=Ascobolus immersus RN42 TaxID=1160509 RepID=A0A3N4HMV9_ASCIM|nr:hypothetical protein BJ508DRAFT_420056 [Ascobolus immersus RN42]
MQFTTITVALFSLLTVGALASPVDTTAAPTEAVIFKRADCAPGSPCRGNLLGSHDAECNRVCRSSLCKKQSGKCGGLGWQICQCNA